MSEKKVLSDGELEKITGGDKSKKRINTSGNLADYADYTIAVNKYSGVIGKKYLFKYHNGNSAWLFGKLNNTYEKFIFFNTERTHDVYVEDGYGTYGVIDDMRCIEVSSYGTIEISGDHYQMYSNE